VAYALTRALVEIPLLAALLLGAQAVAFPRKLVQVTHNEITRHASKLLVVYVLPVLVCTLLTYHVDVQLELSVQLPSFLVNVPLVALENKPVLVS
jgi:hypothetical protein